MTGGLRGWTEAPVPEYDGPRPDSASILISPTGIAHRLGGCAHLPDHPYLVPPRWGWTRDASAWSSIDPHEVAATEGNTGRIATRRCLDCDEAF